RHRRSDQAAQRHAGPGGAGRPRFLMFLPELCIRRPVLATVMRLLVALIGLISYQRLPVREYPNIDEPVITVDTRYPGASAEIMESQITQVLEDSIAGIEWIDYLQSINRQEGSQIAVR